MDPEKMRKRGKLKIISWHFRLQNSSFSLSRPCAQWPEVTKRWGFSCCMQRTSIWAGKMSSTAGWLAVRISSKLCVALCSAWNITLESQERLGGCPNGLTNIDLKETHLPTWLLLKCHWGTRYFCSLQHLIWFLPGTKLQLSICLAVQEGRCKWLRITLLPERYLKGGREMLLKFCCMIFTSKLMLGWPSL